MRPVRLIVGFAPGGPTDIVARIIVPWLSQRLRQSVIIENKPGAGTNIAVQTVVNASPDGYTLLLVASTNAVNVTFYQTLPFNFLRDIEPVAGLVGLPLVMVVNPTFPAKTVPEFIAYAKANSGKISMGSAGVGTVGHLASELFNSMAGVNMIHVPYRGAAPVMTDLLANQVNVTFDGLPAYLAQIQIGTLRALAVTTPTRFNSLPDVPTVGETIPGYEAPAWYGIGAPRHTPPEIIERLNREINAGLMDPGVRKQLADVSTIPLLYSSSEFGAFMAAETEKWGKVVRATGAKPE
jgi:tripartite-type tricarboxylate transporter receptor subunit TctC